MAALPNRAAKWDSDCLVLSDTELRELLDLNARQLLGISGAEFLRLRRLKQPLKNPAWSAVEPIACLIHND